MSMPNKPKICLPCEREKAKLPTYEKLAKERAIREQKTIVVYFDEEDKKYRISTIDTAKSGGYRIASYHTAV